MVKQIEEKSNLYTYAVYLTKELDDYIHEQGIRHKVTIHYSDFLIVCEILFKKSKKKNSFFPKVKKSSNRQSEKLFAEVQKHTKSRFRKWFCTQKSLKIFGKNRVYLCKVPRLSNWTVFQAIVDARDIIEDMILAGNNTVDSLAGVFEDFDKAFNGEVISG